MARFYLMEIYEVAKKVGHLPTPDRYRARIVTGRAPGTYRRTLGTRSVKHLHQRLDECGNDNVTIVTFSSDTEALAYARETTAYLNQKDRV